MVSPDLGWLCLVRISICNSGEYQLSSTISIGRTFPISPVGMMRVVRVPSADTPSIVFVPRDSFFLRFSESVVTGSDFVLFEIEGPGDFGWSEGPEKGGGGFGPTGTVIVFGGLIGSINAVCLPGSRL